MPTTGFRFLVVHTGTLLDDGLFLLLHDQAHGEVRRTFFRDSEALWREISQFRPHVVALYDFVPVDIAGLIRALDGGQDFWPCRFLSISPSDNAVMIYQRSGLQRVTYASSSAFLALVDGRQPLAGPGPVRPRAQIASVSQPH